MHPPSYGGFTLQTHLQGSAPLERLGWSPIFEEQFTTYAARGLTPARVAIEHRDSYVLLTADGELHGEVSGRFRADAASRADYPAVGDWVAVDAAHGIIRALLPRRTRFSRKVAWSPTEEQVVAANVDVVFLVLGLDANFNVRRLERYLTMGWESGAEPVVVLTKRDLCDDVDARVLEAEAVAFGVPVLAVSAVTGQGLDDLEGRLAGHRTGAFLGSSGVGKSTLINSFLGYHALPTHPLREDGRGRHTTTRRELVLLPTGGIVIDTPGMRELQLWTADDGIGAAFQDVEELAAQCRFSDCAHDTEPDCAIQAALADGTLDPERLDSYERLQRELRRLAAKIDKRARAEERKRVRAFSRSIRQLPQKGR
jgi:ribosome biogenesis GTPase